MTKTVLILWRHGETEWNRSGRFQGQTDVGLSELGFLQAHAAARRLAEANPVAIYCSDLLRARQTSAELEKLTGLVPTYDPRLREINVGSWAGRTAQEVTEGFPDYARVVSEWEDFRRSDTGETGSEVRERIGPALTEIADAHPDQTVVVAGHGLSLRMGMGYLIGWQYEDFRVLGPLSNSHWITVRHRHGRWTLTGYNCSVAI